MNGEYQTPGIPLLSPTDNPRPGAGWVLEDYSWNEKSGVARLKYKRRGDPSQRVVVDQFQPAAPDMPGWCVRKPLDRAAAMERHADAIRVTRQMQQVGAYGR